MHTQQPWKILILRFFRERGYDRIVTAGFSMRQPDSPTQPEDTAGAGHAGVVQHYRPALLRYFKRHLGDQAEVEDLAQETLLRYTRSAPAYALQDPEPYLLRIAGNLLRDRHRRVQSHHADQHVSLDAVPDMWNQDMPTCEDVYEYQDRLRRLQRTLRQLPSQCRHVFILQRFEGMTYTEVARQLGISVSSVEKHMMRALLHINARMPPP